MGILGSILGTLLTTVLGWIKGYLELWMARKRAEAAEAAAARDKGMLESTQEAVSDEATIRKAVPPVVNSPSGWNAAKVLLLGLMLVPLTGCWLKGPSYVDGRRPIIDIPPRPVLPTDPPTFSPREQLLADYAMLLETRVRTYNDLAGKHNTKYGYK